MEASVEFLTSCPECGSERLVKDYMRAEIVCEICGLVLDDLLMDPRGESRGFNAEEEKKLARTGAPMNISLHDKGLSTEIGWGNRDYLGRQLTHKNRMQVHRMRKWQYRTRARNTAERNMMKALKELGVISSRMGLPRSVKERGATIYRQAVDKNIIRGRNTDCLVAASIYAACRVCSVPRTLDEITKHTDIKSSKAKKRKVGKAYRFLVRALKLQVAPPMANAFIPRYFNDLNLPWDVREKTVELIDLADKDGFTVGKSPLCVAAGAIYLASRLCNKKVPQRDIVKAMGVTEVSIRNRYKEMVQRLDITMP